MCMATSTEAPPAYAELFCLSNYSFLQAASHPEELVGRAAQLGYQALALTDECSLSGVVRAHQAAREAGLRLLIGAHFRLPDTPTLVCLAQTPAGYRRLCRLISQARRRAPKGEYRLTREDLEDGLPGCLVLLHLAPDTPDADLAWFRRAFGDSAWIGVSLLRDGRDPALLARARQATRTHGLGCVAVGQVRMHARGRRVLLDTLSAIRLGVPLDRLGQQAAGNGEQHLRRREDLARIYPAEWLARSVELARRCRFSLDSLRYAYPDDVTPPGMQRHAYLRQLVEQGVRRRWPGGCDERVRAQIEHELRLIAELGYEAYFLTIWDIVRHARARGILCQGRGSAANSAVCYCLGITEVDPARANLLFERFISRERNEPPDIDVDFEHQRREEVIQYIYEKYGRERAALTATVITYRARSALRDCARALGLDATRIEALGQALSSWRRHGGIDAEALREAGFDPDSPLMQRLCYLANALRGFPRHLSQHVGGFVISRERLDVLVPVENAAMPGRTVIQWEKDDLEALGLLKVDILSLGMLSALRRCLDLVGRQRGQALRLQDIPAEDPAVYAMLQRADTMGVFQIESRAQMAMLPRLRPRHFYELVIEIAIVRPGPIQGDMVHPYLRRKQGREPVDYPSPEVRAVLERTLGVPIFQEQVIKLAMVAAGFSPGEADQLRRAMAAWKRRGGLSPYRERLLRGMHERGYSRDFAERIYRQILGFGDYGFPESHAASFALLAYASAWLKCHHPAAFCAALLNSQPMGFYQPAQLLDDARRHGVDVCPVDVRHSDWDCTLEGEAPRLRLGLRMVAGLGREAAERLLRARRQAPFRDLDDLAARSGLERRALQALAAADALSGLAGHRHLAAWAVAGIEHGADLMRAPRFAERQPQLFPPSEAEQVLADYAHTGLSLRQHPLALLREALRARGFLSAAEVGGRADGEGVRAAGLVLVRQRPGQGKAVFITLEDETGQLNLLVWSRLAERQRRILLGARLLGVNARLQRAEGVQHLIVHRLEDHSELLGPLQIRSRDFC